MNAASSDLRLSVSLGTASVLGLVSAPCEPPPTTAYLMAGGRCVRDCLFCAQARNSTARTDALARITWPAVDRGDALHSLAEMPYSVGIERICVQSTCSPGGLERSTALVRDLVSAAALPVCASAHPAGDSEVDAYFTAGADIVGFGLDAVTPALYAAVKQPDVDHTTGARAWQRHLDLVLSTAARYPGRAAAHLIIGLGESEREAIDLIQQLVDHGVIVAIFAFTPVRGTALERRHPPPIGAYRRVQAARWLIDTRECHAQDMSFDADERLVSFGPSRAGLRAMLLDGSAFRTSGCPGCNRPYYNERPGGVMYNFPRPLTESEIERAITDMGMP